MFANDVEGEELCGISGIPTLCPPSYLFSIFQEGGHNQWFSRLLREAPMLLECRKSNRVRRPPPPPSVRK